MSEQTQVIVEAPLLVTTKDPKKVAAGKKLAEFKRRKKEELAQEAKARESKPKLSHSVGAVIVIGVLGLLGYYIYQRGSPGDNNDVKVTSVETRTNKFEME